MSRVDPILQEVPLVLIVDDDQDILTLLTRILAGRDLRTHALLSGEESLKFLEEHEPEVVLLDLMMPGISGNEVFTRIRQAHPLTQIVIVTGRGDEMTAAALMKDGAADYIAKPFDNALIPQAVERALARRNEIIRSLKAEADKQEEERRLRQEKESLAGVVRDTTRELDAKTDLLEQTNRQLQETNSALQEKNREITRLERIYQEIFDRAGDGIMTMNLAGRILMANQRAHAILGEARRLRGHSLKAYVTAASLAKFQELLTSLASGRVSFDEVEVETPDREGPRTINLRVVPLKRKGQPIALEVLMTDITDRLREQQVMRKLEERAIVAGLSRHLSHTLLNSLTSAGGYLAKIEKGLPESGRQVGWFRIIKNDMGRMEEVVRGYQDYVNIMNLRPSSLVDLATFLSGFIYALAAGGDSEVNRILGSQRRDFEIGKESLAVGSATVLVDAFFLTVGLAYLLKGAAFHAAGQSAKATFSISIARENGTASFCVLTAGCSVPSQVIAGMYNPWEHQMLHQTFEDWGITIANAVAERHNGRLTVENTPEGTLYRLNLPVATI